jgi:hypothetical protein
MPGTPFVQSPFSAERQILSAISLAGLHNLFIVYGHTRVQIYFHFEEDIMHRHMATKVLVGLGLAAGASMLMHRLAEHRCDIAPGPLGPGERHGWHRAWTKGYPLIFEDWHRQAHAQQDQTSTPAKDQPPAPAS